MLERELILDRYRIIGKAGSGGYATVQHAFDTRLKRDVAIKCIRITRADVDAAKRTAALLRQIDPGSQHDIPSIPIGSSRVIPAGGSALARIRKDSTRSVYGAARKKAGGAFGTFEAAGGGALPTEPGFLSKREERLARKRGAKTELSARSAFDARASFSPEAAQQAAPKGTEEDETERISAPRDIPALADMLPGAIKGAGETKISGVDSDAISISLDLAALLDEGRDEDASDAGAAGLAGISDVRRQGADAGRARPSFLDAMDADEAARWKGSGGPDADYYRNLALGGVNDLGFDAASQRPSVAAVQQWQERAAAQQRHEQNVRTRVAARGRVHAPEARSEALTPEELSQLDTVPGLEEARTAAHLNDANIVTVYDCVVEGDMAYVIMEYVEGKTLARLIRELGDEVTLDMVSAVFASVSHALEVAHKANVLHLDIKPENVIVNKEGVVKVTDFGLSTLMDGSGQGKTGGGTIGYMPLEQMRRQPLDVRTDEWALASLTYEMLTGSNPFRAKTLADAEIAIEDAEIILPSRCWDGMDEEIDDVMFTALSPDADGRYETVTAFSRMLLPLLANAKEGGKQLGRAVAVSPLQEEAQAVEEKREPAKGGLFGGLLGRAKGAGGADAKGKDAPREERASKAAATAIDGSGARSGNDAVGGSGREGSQREERAPRQPRAPKVPLIDRIGEQGAGIVMRAVAGISSIMVAVVALLNFRVVFDGGQNVMQDTTFGLFSTLPIAAWIVMAVLAAVAFIKPKIGFVAVYAAFALSLMVSQAWTAALLLLVGMGAWWWFFGRMSDAACTLVMMQPLLGSIGFAAVVPVVAGAVLDVRDALAAAGAAAVSAVVFAALGSGSLANWEVLANFIVAVNPVIAGASITNGLVEVLSNAVSWCVGASWVAAAGMYSLFCVKGSKVFDMMGSFACAILLICGMLIAPFFLGDANALLPLSIAGTVIPAIVGVIFAFANVTDRVRMAEGEW